MLKTLNKYIDDRPARGVVESARLWLHDERVFARLLAISAVLHICFYAAIIIWNSWAMRQIKPLRPQSPPLQLITEIAPANPPSRLRSPNAALERADANRFEYDPQTANDTDLIARSPNPSSQHGNRGVRPEASDTGSSIRPPGGSQNNPSDRGPGQQPPAIAAVPSVRAPQPPASATLTPSTLPPAPPAPRPAPTPSPDAAAGTQRGTGSESTAFGTQRISAQYMALVQAKVRRVNEAYMPRGFVETTLGSEVSADFDLVLNRRGQIEKLNLRRSSGFRALDATARQAILSASPFEGYPQSAGDTILLKVTVRYHP